ncbi:phenylalanine--tRNA ligase subunit beta [Helicobacter sp. 23-1044]
MKFSRNLLSKIIDISKVSDEVLYKTLNDIGLEVESFSKISVPKNVVIGKVVEKSKHENADKLSICKVDIGSEVLQIVCGAKNVAKNQIVPVAKVGAKLGDLEIKKGNLRGAESNGMICSSTELGLPKIEEGIFVLDDSIGEVVLGKELCEYTLFDDSIFEIAITPNRGDCLSVFGVAMDLLAALNLNLQTIKNREKNNEIAPGIGRILNISFEKNLHTSLCYKVAQIKDLYCNAELRLNLAINDMLSDDCLHNMLRFSCYMTGVIIRAYAFDKFANSEDKIILQIKRDENGMEGVFFEDKKLSTIGLGDEILANKHSQLVVFEASFIPPHIIAESIFKNAIKSDCKTSYLSKRGSSPLLEDGILCISYLLESMSQSIIYSSTQNLLQNYPQRRIDFHFEDISAIIGNMIKNEEITSILNRMGFMINSASDDKISAIPPRYRHDIRFVQDIAEEILRLKGIDLVEAKAQILPNSANINDDYRFYKFRRNIAKKAISRGFFEALHYVFCQRATLEKYNLPLIAENLDLLNPITNELNTLRTSLIPSMLDSLKRNQNFGYEKLALFEMGSIYNAKREESQNLAFVAGGLKSECKYPTPKGEKWDFYAFASAISDILGGVELENAEFAVDSAKDSAVNSNKDSANKDSVKRKKSAKYATFAESSGDLFHKGICAKIIKNGAIVGIIGALNPFIASDLEMENIFMAQIDLESLFSAEKNTAFMEFSHFQGMDREFSILVDKNTNFSEIKRAILEAKIPHLAKITALDLYKSDEFGDKISISFKATFQAMDTTLKAQDLGDKKILEILRQTFNAEIRCE